MAVSQDLYGVVLLRPTRQDVSDDPSIEDRQLRHYLSPVVTDPIERIANGQRDVDPQP